MKEAKEENDDCFFFQERSTEEPEVCGGLIWRGKASNYISSYNSIESKESLRLLKRKSCPGCSRCDWVLDAMKEDFPEMPIIIDGRLYTYFIHTFKDWETTELDHIEIVEVKE